MKLTVYDISKHNKSIKMLEARKAPNYIIEAYKDGHANVVNKYYEYKIKKSPMSLTESKLDLDKLISETKLEYLKEAYSKKDYDFINLFYKFTNMDILGNVKVPPHVGKHLKPGMPSTVKMTDLFKKAR